VLGHVLIQLKGNQPRPLASMREHVCRRAAHEAHYSSSGIHLTVGTADQIRNSTHQLLARELINHIPDKPPD
jgi:hypothetical protein